MLGKKNTNGADRLAGRLNTDHWGVGLLVIKPILLVEVTSHQPNLIMGMH